MKRIHLLLAFIIASLAAAAANPGATSYSSFDCRGTYALYPSDVVVAAYPDSLTPVMISHVGRHGSRFPASAKGMKRIVEALDAATEAGTITDTGKKLRALATEVSAVTAGQWGALDSLGMAEIRGIASRMVKAYPSLFDGTTIEAISSYAPRCIMSMYTFCHQISRLNNSVTLTTSSGRAYSDLLRPFDLDAEYLAYRETERWQQTLAEFQATELTTAPLLRALGGDCGYSDDDLRRLALDEYQLVAGAAAAGVATQWADFFTIEEYNRLWQSENMRMYLLYSANVVSTIPADMASPLLMSITSGLDAAASGDRSIPSVMLRFGHAETLLPLTALLRLPGCYYMTNYFDMVASRWADFRITPMAANLQFILFKSRKGRYYLRVDLNEMPVALMPDSDVLYTPWSTAKSYMQRCIPIFYQ